MISSISTFSRAFLQAAVFLDSSSIKIEKCADIRSTFEQCGKSSYFQRIKIAAIFKNISKLHILQNRAIIPWLIQNSVCIVPVFLLFPLFKNTFSYLLEEDAEIKMKFAQEAENLIKKDLSLLHENQKNLENLLCLAAATSSIALIYLGNVLEGSMGLSAAIISFGKEYSFLPHHLEKVMDKISIYHREILALDILFNMDIRGSKLKLGFEAAFIFYTLRSYFPIRLNFPLIPWAAI